MKRKVSMPGDITTKGEPNMHTRTRYHRARDQRSALWRKRRRQVCRRRTLRNRVTQKLYGDNGDGAQTVKTTRPENFFIARAVNLVKQAMRHKDYQQAQSR